MYDLKFKKIIQPTLGFTLLELLVVVTIIAVLSAAGLAVFSNSQKNAKDARRKADIDAIAKVYESKYDLKTGLYPVLSDSDFSSGKFPSPPEGGTYSGFLDADNKGFQVCAALESNPSRECSASRDNCYCRASNQGKEDVVNFPASCDPNGTLGTGLVGYWKFDENSGSIANDSSGNAYNATIYSATPSSGKFGLARYFSGSSQYVAQNPAGSSLNILDNVTLTFWIKLPDASTAAGYRAIVMKGTGACCGTERQYGVYAHSNSTNWDFLHVVNSKLDSSGQWSSDLSYPLSPNLWHQVAVVITTANNGSHILYVDGAERQRSINKGFTGLRASSTNVFNIGKADNYFKGDIDDVRIYNRALASDEVVALWSSSNGCVP